MARKQTNKQANKLVKLVYPCPIGVATAITTVGNETQNHFPNPKNQFRYLRIC